MICNQCGRQNEDNALFCQYCGVKLEKVCPLCNAKVDPMVDICPYCGAYINAPKEQKKSPAAYSPRRKFVFTMAILSNVFTSFFGFIFGIIAWRAGNKELIKYPRDWMVKVGRIIGKIFTFVSIGATIYFIIILIVSIIAGSGAVSNTNSPYLLR